MSGRVVVVTGASSGIGQATARRFARTGAVVVLAARRERRLRALADELTGEGWAAVPARCDVTSRREIESLRDEVGRTLGRCDVLVNNAGIPGGGRFEDVTLEQLDLVTATNYLGVLWCTKLFLPLLVASRGHVVNVASMAGRYAIPGSAAYSASKHAVVALSEALHHELKPAGVAVTVVNPGLVATEGFPHEGMGDDPRGRFVMSPERVAEVIMGVVRTRKGPEISVPRWLGAFQAFRVLTPPLYRAGLGRVAARRPRSAEVEPGRLPDAD